MRRRQIYAQQAAMPAIEIVEEPPKGTCPKCKRFIGRGVAMHTRHCNG